MDCRALRLNFSSDVRVYEIDVEEVLNFKNSILSNLQNDSNFTWKPSLPIENRHCICMDFKIKDSPWKKSLLESTFRVNEPTFWLMEGLLMYLTWEDITQIYETIAELSSTGSMILSHHGKPEPNQEHHKFFKEINAPISSSSTFEEMQSLLNKSGFTNATKTIPLEMGDWVQQRIKERGLTDEDAQHFSFYFCMAEKN